MLQEEAEKWNGGRRDGTLQSGLRWSRVRSALSVCRMWAFQFLVPVMGCEWELSSLSSAEEILP